MRFVFFVVASLLFNCLFASAQSIMIQGGVKNGITDRGLARAVVRLISTGNGKIVATDTTRLKVVEEISGGNTLTYLDKAGGAAFSVVLTEAKRVTLIVEADGYKPYSKTIEVSAMANRSIVDVGNIALFPLPKVRQLGEAKVKATRIKMFYKGDTLVYNADAFDVKQSESLRALVMQLPGAEMKDGLITVNGKQIDNLLIGGKDFFSGNMQAALDNLPAYVVSKIKVYDKAGDMSELTGQDMHDKSYVMDVHLKRKYVGLWMAKFEADGGTESMRGGQGYIMRMDDRQMFSLTADVNNFNQDRQMFDVGNIMSFYNWGRIQTKRANMTYYVEPNATWRFKTNISAKRTDSKENAWTSTETFLSPTNLMTRSIEKEKTDNTSINAMLALRARRSRFWQHEIDYKLSIAEYNRMSDAKSLAYFRTEGNRWDGFPTDSIENITTYDGLLYTLFNPQKQNRRNVGHEVNYTSSFVLGKNVLKFNAGMKQSTITEKFYSNYNLTYHEAGNKDLRRQFKNNRDYEIEANAKAEFVYKYERRDSYDGTLKPYASFTHTYGTSSHPLYRLERMEAWSEQMEWDLASLGVLPQADFRSLCIDEENSMKSNEAKKNTETGISLSHRFLMKSGSSVLLCADGRFYYERRELDYNRNPKDYDVSRDGLFVAPFVSAEWKAPKESQHSWNAECLVAYDGKPTMVKLTNLLPIRDSSDPINLYFGNESLKNMFTHHVKGNFKLRNKNSSAITFVADYQRVINDISLQSTYSPESGIRTYQTVNTQHTYSIKGNLGYEMPIDRKQRFFASVSFATDYYQSAILSTIESDASSIKGILRNTTLTPSILLRGNFSKKFRTFIKWSTRFQHVAQPQISNDYRETMLTADFTWTMPLGFELTSDVKFRTLSGISDASLDKNIVLWNARLGKQLFKDKLSLSLTVSDILSRASSYFSSVSAVSRMERYTDVVPRYVMLSAVYYLNWTSKNK